MSEKQNPGAVSSTTAGVKNVGPEKKHPKNSERLRWEQTARVREALRNRTKPLAEALFGPAKRRSGPNLRYSKQGGLSVCDAGPKCGLWKNWDTGECGGPLDLVQLRFKCDLDAALAWAEAWLKDQQQ